LYVVVRRLRGLSCGPELLLHLCSQVVQWNKAGALVSKAVSSGVINTRETRPPYLVNFQLDLTLYGRLDTFDKKNVCFRIVEERLCLPRPPARPSNGVACKAKALVAVQGAIPRHRAHAVLQHLLVSGRIHFCD
jgi:hypothetical protein